MADPWAEFVGGSAPAAKKDEWADFGAAAPEPEAKQSGWRGTGTFLPFKRDETGLHWAVPLALQEVGNQVTTLGKVGKGELSPFSDEAIGASLNAALTFNPMPVASRAGAGWAGVPISPKKVEPPVPTAEALQSTAKGQYDQALGMDARYKADAVAQWAKQMRADLERQGFRDHRAPDTFSALDRLANPPAGGPDTATFASLADLHAAHGELSSIAGAPNINRPADPAVAGIVDRGLKEFIERSDPESVVAGTPTREAADIYGTAGANYGASKRAALIGNREDYAAIKAASANSGQNYDNAARQRIAELLKAEITGEGRNKIRGFNEEEIKALTDFSTGDLNRNMTRRLANVLGGGGGMHQFNVGAIGTGAGAALGSAAGPMGGVIGGLIGGAAGVGAGAAAKAYQNKLADKELGGIVESLLKRSPAYEKALADAPLKAAPNPVARDNLIRYLMELQAAEQAKQPQRVAPEA